MLSLLHWLAKHSFRNNIRYWDPKQNRRAGGKIERFTQECILKFLEPTAVAKISYLLTAIYLLWLSDMSRYYSYMGLVRTTQKLISVKTAVSLRKHTPLTEYRQSYTVNLFCDFMQDLWSGVMSQRRCEQAVGVEHSRNLTHEASATTVLVF